MSSSDSTMKELLRKRGSDYGRTWYLAGEVMGLLSTPFHNLLHNAPWVAHNWVLILSKLIRTLYTPRNQDHWRDIIGYATLILEQLEEDDGQKRSI